MFRPIFVDPTTTGQESASALLREAMQGIFASISSFTKTVVNVSDTKPESDDVYQLRMRYPLV